MGVARRRPLPRGVGGEPPAAQLHAVGAGDLVLELGRPARRRTAVPAPAERVARRGRCCADVLRRPRAQPRGPAARPARRGDGRPRSAGPRPVLPRYERRVGVRRRQRVAVGDTAMLPPPWVAARSPAPQRVRRGVVRVTRGHDAAGDHAGRRGGRLGPRGARAAARGAACGRPRSRCSSGWVRPAWRSAGSTCATSASTATSVPRPSCSTTSAAGRPGRCRTSSGSGTCGCGCTGG